MKPIPKFLTRVLTASLTFTSIFPAHAAPLALSQLPPTTITPATPNLIVTIDDSGSMLRLVPYDPLTTYSIPTGPTGLPIKPPLVPPNVDAFGYSPVSNILSINTVANQSRTDDPLNGYNFRQAYSLLTTPEQRLNYVNWYTYYRNRLNAMKAAVMSAFSEQRVPDDQFRLAWQSLNYSCAGGFQSTFYSGCPDGNSMWPLSDIVGGRTHRTNFFNWVRQINTRPDTPLRAAYTRAGEYLKVTGINSPWAYLPGVTQGPELSCRRSYHILFTDGGHKEPNDTGFGNADNQNVTLPDGRQYVGAGASRIRPYPGKADNQGDFTLSDVAFKYWATDLQTGPGFDNVLQPVIKFSGNETYGGVTVPEYWNPKNNPASWQHLVTFAIGFGEAANLTNPQWAGATTAGPAFAKIVDGSSEWPDVDSSGGGQVNVADLWHAAVNSRGELFPATDQVALTNAFNSILSGISGKPVTTGGSTGSLGIPVAADFTLVKAGFVGVPTLRGDIKGYGISPGGIISSTEAWDAQSVVSAQSPASRVVLSASAPLSGIPFRWASLGTYGQNSLNQTHLGSPDGLGADRVDFLRGVQDKEAVPDPSTGLPAAGDVFRDRKGGLIGTVANSEPRIVQSPRSGYISPAYRAFRSSNLSRTPIAYIGANDGMLHGIKTATGEAVLSYVPRAAYPKLPFYTAPAYTHNMYVDGPIISSDFQDSTGWKTVLVGGLGAGGKGVFALDVTDPSSFSESNARTLVKFDYTAPAGTLPAEFVTESGTSPMLAELQTDMGHVYGDPSRDSFIGRNLQVTKMQNGRWAVITGNGVNSVGERAVLYIIYLDSGSGTTEFVKITTPATGAANGLSVPFPADFNGDGLTDTVYAGDLLGNMWKFDVKSNSQTDWVLPGNTNLIIATGRPISTAPTLLVHPQGGVLVSFGTGRQLTDSDYNSTAKEAIYGVWDKPSGPVTVADTDLAVRTLDAINDYTNAPSAAEVAAGAPPPAEVRVFTGGVVPAVDYGSMRGWKIILDKPKEKVIYNPIGDGRRVFYSITEPLNSSNACTVAELAGSFLAFDGISGTEPPSPILDLNGDKKFSPARLDQKQGKSVVGRAAPVGRLVGIVSPPAPPAGAPAATVPCLDPANLAVGALGQMCVAKYGGPGRILWRDMRP